MNNLTNLSLVETLAGLKESDFTEEELNKAYYERLEDLNSRLNIFLTIEKKPKGIPVGIKDVISTKDIITTAGSRILKTYKPPFNATVVEKLLKQGMNIIGKTNNDEFAMGSSGENSSFGATKNPWNEMKVPGGSSSGSAAAVAADLCVFAVGTDTGGSIRQPASLCGVVGLKPSYGRCSRYGLIAMASSLDCPGCFTKSVADSRQVLDWISGPDGHDTNVKNSKLKTQSSKIQIKSQSIKGVKIGIPKEYFGEGLDPKVSDVIKTAIKKLEDLGAQIIEVSLPHTKYALSAYYIIVFSEISSNLARFDGIRFGGQRVDFGAEPKRRIMLGTFTLSAGYYDAYFTKAAKVRTLVKQDFEKAFGQCECIVGPVSPTVAWNLGEKINDPLQMYLSDAYTIPASLAGIPGLSVPCGFVDGLPVGLQILGKYFDEETILDVGEVYEQSTEWHLQRPDLKLTI